MGALDRSAEKDIEMLGTGRTIRNIDWQGISWRALELVLS
jgi:hypothetical protein